MTRATRSKKNSSHNERSGGIKVATVTMMLRYCHTCGFLARFPSLAFYFSAWLKGFCLLRCRHTQSLSSVAVLPERAPPATDGIDTESIWIFLGFPARI